MITEGVDQFRKVRKNFSKEVAREEKSEKKGGVGGGRSTVYRRCWRMKRESMEG